MNLPDVLNLVHSLMEEADIGDWGLVFDRARRRVGQMDHARHRITFSRHPVSLYDEVQVRETILHEITRTRAGPRHGHDAVRVAETTRLGATGRRFIDAQAPRLWGRQVGRCPADYEVDRTYRPTSPVSCSCCVPRFSLDHLLAWSPDDEPIPHERINERYSRPLRLAHIQPPDDLAGPSRTLSSWPPLSPAIPWRSSRDRHHHPHRRGMPRHPVPASRMR